MSGNKLALLIGINYFRTPDISLRGCINDTETIKDVLVNGFGYNPSNIVSLRDDATNPAYHPTYNTILSQITAIVSHSKYVEEIWITYSGHGTKMNPNSTQEFIVPSDYDRRGVIGDDILFGILKQVKCRCFVLIDACHSGQMGDMPFSFSYNNPDTYTLSRDFPYDLENKDIFVLSGCKMYQTSADIYDTDDKQFEGAFTDAFVDCMKEANYTIPLMELFRNICMKLKRDGYEQIPVLSSPSMKPSYAFSPTILTGALTKKMVHI